MLNEYTTPMRSCKISIYILPTNVLFDGKMYILASCWRHRYYFVMYSYCRVCARMSTLLHSISLVTCLKTVQPLQRPLDSITNIPTVTLDSLTHIPHTLRDLFLDSSHSALLLCQASLRSNASRKKAAYSCIRPSLNWQTFKACVKLCAVVGTIHW